MSAYSSAAMRAAAASTSPVYKQAVPAPDRPKRSQAKIAAPAVTEYDPAALSTGPKLVYAPASNGYVGSDDGGDDGGLYASRAGLSPGGYQRGQQQHARSKSTLPGNGPASASSASLSRKPSSLPTPTGTNGSSFLRSTPLPGGTSIPSLPPSALAAYSSSSRPALSSAGGSAPATSYYRTMPSVVYDPSAANTTAAAAAEDRSNGHGMPLSVPIPAGMTAFPIRIVPGTTTSTDHQGSSVAGEYQYRSYPVRVVSTGLAVPYTLSAPAHPASASASRMPMMMPASPPSAPPQHLQSNHHMLRPSLVAGFESSSSGGGGSGAMMLSPPRRIVDERMMAATTPLAAPPAAAASGAPFQSPSSSSSSAAAQHQHQQHWSSLVAQGGLPPPPQLASHPASPLSPASTSQASANASRVASPASPSTSTSPSAPSASKSPLRKHSAFFAGETTAAPPGTLALEGGPLTTAVAPALKLGPPSPDGSLAVGLVRTVSDGGEETEGPTATVAATTGQENAKEDDDDDGYETETVRVTAVIRRPRPRPRPRPMQRPLDDAPAGEGAAAGSSGAALFSSDDSDYAPSSSSPSAAGAAGASAPRGALVDRDALLVASAVAEALQARGQYFLEGEGEGDEGGEGGDGSGSGTEVETGHHHKHNKKRLVGIEVLRSIGAVPPARRLSSGSGSGPRRHHHHHHHHPRLHPHPDQDQEQRRAAAAKNNNDEDEDEHAAAAAAGSSAIVSPASVASAGAAAVAEAAAALAAVATEAAAEGAREAAELAREAATGGGGAAGGGRTVQAAAGEADAAVAGGAVAPSAAAEGASASGTGINGGNGAVVTAAGIDVTADGLASGGSSVPPTFAPGSPFDLALQARIKKGRRRPHLKPEGLKRLQQGEEEYERRKKAKELGKIINKEHKQYHTSFGMMLGIYASVVNTMTFNAEKLVLDDFMKVRKLKFPPQGTALTPPHALPSSFTFKDYAPKVFHHLRNRFSIDAKHYLSSLGGAYEYIEFSSNSKSGSFFFYSHDGKFMIKTQSRAESKFLRRILAHYYQYIMDNPHTYLTRFYGMHRIKMPHLRKKIHFVVMQSVFYGDKPIQTMFDLKGSTVGRSATEKEKARGPDKCVFKDLDLMQQALKIKLGPGRREAFLQQIRNDASFLERMSIMDYSLLLGVHYQSKATGGLGSLPAHALPVAHSTNATANAAVGAGASASATATTTIVGGGEAAAKGGDQESKENGDAADAAGTRSGGSADAPGTRTNSSASATTTAATAHNSGTATAGSRSAGSGHSRYFSESSSSSSDAAGGSSSSLSPSSVGGAAGHPSSGSSAAVSGPILPPHPEPAAGMGISSLVPANAASSSSSLSPSSLLWVPGDEVYYFGIIDILQQYDLRKRSESVIRKMYQRPASGISAVDPKAYGDRFVKFLTEHSS